MSDNECSGHSFLKGLIIGSILGAVAGVLFAPKSGKELRADIKEKSGEVLKDAKAIIEEAKQKAADLKKEADRYLDEAKQKARDILSRQGKKETETGAAE